MTDADKRRHAAHVRRYRAIEKAGNTPKYQAMLERDRKRYAANAEENRAYARARKKLLRDVKSALRKAPHQRPWRPFVAPDYLKSS